MHGAHAEVADTHAACALQQVAKGDDDLRVLEGQEFQRVGGTKSLKADVRVIAASNKDLAEEIRRGAFREDLYYRLNVVPLEVPALRERVDDIPRLARHFLQEFSVEYGQKPKVIDDAALSLFIAYHWPGNVRELRNVIERLIIMVPNPAISAGDVPPPISSQRETPATSSDGDRVGHNHKTLKGARSEFERDFIARKLKEYGGNVSRTADAIGVERSNLHRKIKALGIESED